MDNVNDDVEIVYYDENEQDFNDLENDEMENNDQIANDDSGDEDAELVFDKPDVDNSILTFSKHTEPVFCCSIHPEKDICASGGQDDKAYIWNIKNGDILHQIDHKDTVITSYFNHDGKYLATGDLSGYIKVCRINENYENIWEYSMGDMSWLKWHTSSNVLLAGSDTGEIYIWRVPHEECKILVGNGHSCQTAELTNDGKKIFAGYSDGTLRLWDIKNSSIIVEVNSKTSLRCHINSVLCVSCDTDQQLFLAGSEEGKIILLNNLGPICILNQSATSVENIAFCPDGNLKIAASGNLNGDINIWDITKQCLRTKCQIDNEMNDGITALKWLPQQTLICGTQRGRIHAFDGVSGIHKYSLLGHSNFIYDMQYCKRENILATASEDGTVKIFKLVD